MKGTILYGPRDVRFEERDAPAIIEPTDAIVRISATCVCGSDLWPYRGVSRFPEPSPMGHEYCGIIEKVGSAVTSIKPEQFVIGSFATSDKTCPHCRAGYQTSCVHRDKIKPEITKISMNGIDDAWKKVFDKQARYRFVIDMGVIMRYHFARMIRTFR